jgi:hypothetical protein
MSDDASIAHRVASRGKGVRRAPLKDATAAPIRSDGEAVTQVVMIEGVTID